MTPAQTTTPARRGKLRTVMLAAVAIVAAPFLVLLVLGAIVGERR